MNPLFILTTLCGLVLIAPTAVAGIWSFTNLAGGGDLESGVGPAKAYTHLVDFGADPTATTINGVAFTGKGMTGANYSLVGTGGSVVNNGEGPFAGTGLGDLFTDFFYGGSRASDAGSPTVFHWPASFRSARMISGACAVPGWGLWRW